MLESAKQVAGGEKTSMALLRAGPYMLQCQNRYSSGIVVWGNRSLLTGLRPAPQEEFHVWYYKLGQKSMDWEIIGLSKAPIGVVTK